MPKMEPQYACGPRGTTHTSCGALERRRAGDERRRVHCLDGNSNQLSCGSLKRVPRLLGTTRGVTEARRGAEEVGGASATKTAPEVKTKQRRRRTTQPGQVRVIPAAPLGPTDGPGGRNRREVVLTGEEDERGDFGRRSSNAETTRSCGSKSRLG